MARVSGELSQKSTSPVTNHMIYPDMMTISELKITKFNQLDHDASLLKVLSWVFLPPQNRSSFKAVPMVSILETSYPTFGFPDTTTLVKPKRCTLATKGLASRDSEVPRVSASQNLYSNEIMAGKWWHTFTLGGSKMVTFSLPSFFIIGNQCLLGTPTTKTLTTRSSPSWVDIRWLQETS